jgi:glycine/D-amino acid oxidase-like deaminating enzyme
MHPCRARAARACTVPIVDGQRADVVIAGAGIAGLAAAWQLSRRLPRARIILVDPQPPLSVTSDRPDSSYRAWWPEPEMARLAERSIRIMEDLRDAGAAFAMDRRGYLYVTADPARAAGFESRIAAAGGRDVAQLLDAATLRRAYPHLAADLVAGLLVRRAGGVDGVALGRLLLGAARDRGVAPLRGSVQAVDVRRGRVTGARVATPAGERRLLAPLFVNAAGPWAGAVASLLGEVHPFEPSCGRRSSSATRPGSFPATRRSRSASTSGR